jgi:plasmid stability protein
MPNLTIKNIPEAIYRRLKQAAEENHRSLNGQVIACLDEALSPPSISVEEQLAHIRKLRQGLQTKHFRAADVLKAIETGRRK